MADDLQQLISPTLAIAKQVGIKLIEYWGQLDRSQVQRKQDNTLLTEADLVANEILHERLNSLTPTIPILSEEDPWIDFSVRSQWELYWLLDPLDGTRGFIEKNPEYSINIALIQNHQPVLGVIYVPQKQVYYYATMNGGSFKLQQGQDILALHCQPIDLSNIRIILGRYHRSARLISALAAFPDYQLFRLNSSWKFGFIAEGRADIYPRLGPTSQWDTAAGQCILQEAGGLVVDFAGNTLQYNDAPSLSNPEFLAISDPTRLKVLLEIINQRRIE